LAGTPILKRWLRAIKGLKVIEPVKIGQPLTGRQNAPVRQLGLSCQDSDLGRSRVRRIRGLEDQGVQGPEVLGLPEHAKLS
jgi:hypothetical protein